MSYPGLGITRIQYDGSNLSLLTPHTSLQTVRFDNKCKAISTP